MIATLCRKMQLSLWALHWGKIPDIVLSDCYGKATDREILDQTENAFKEQGFRVSINQPFSGGFITKTLW